MHRHGFRTSTSVSRSLAGLAAAALLVPLVVTAGAVADPEPRGPRAAPPGQAQELENKEEEGHELRKAHADETGHVRGDLYRKGVQRFRAMAIDASLRPTGNGAERAKAAAAARRAGRAATSTDAPLAGSSSTTSLAPGAAPAGGSGVRGVQWTQIGPAPLIIEAEQNFQGVGPDAGQVTDIAVDPRNATARVLYATFNDGGVWKTTDGGLSWAPKTDDMPSLSMGAVALDPGNPAIVYAGTGNLFNNGYFKADGVYRSTDSGETWSGTAGSDVFRAGGGLGIRRIVLPSPGVLMVATNGGLFRSVNGGATFGANAPAFDDGQPVETGFVTDLRLDPDDPQTVYAGISGRGLFRSSDGGQTFGNSLFTGTNGGLAAGNYRFVAFAISDAPDTNTLYLDLQSPAGSASRFGGFFKSIDRGATWLNMTAAANLGGRFDACQCGYDQTLAVDPNDANRVYLGFQELWRSENGGTTFTNVTDSLVHWDHHAITFDPPGHRVAGQPIAMFVGTDGGIVRTSDNAGSWTHLNAKIATNVIRGIDIGRGAANNGWTYGGAQDTGTMQRRPGETAGEWRMQINGDGNVMAVAWDDPRFAYGSSNFNYIYTTNGGTTWVRDGAGGLPACAAISSVAAVDPSDGRNVYLPAICDTGSPAPRIWRSTDRGVSFPADRVIPLTVAAINIDVPLADGDLAWLALNDGRVARVDGLRTAATPTVTYLTIPGAPVGQAPTDIVVDPTNTDGVVVTFGGQTNPAAGALTRHVFRTDDNGATWRDYGGTVGQDASNLPDLPVYSVVIDPGTTPQSTIVSTDLGVLRSTDLGRSWHRLGVGLPNVNSNSLQIDYTVTPSLVRLGTYGRSTFELTTATGPILATDGDLAFGTVGVGGSVDRPVRVFNVGNADLHVTGFGFQGAPVDFRVVSGPAAPVTIPPGSSVSYTVRFRPTSGGDKAATLQISSDDPSDPVQLLQASGTGATGIVSVSGSLDFGTVPRGTAATRDITVYNAGGGTLTVPQPTFLAGGDPSYTLVSPLGTQSLAPGDFRNYTVRFAPPADSGAGTRTATLRIDGDDPAPPVDVPATGEVGVPDIAVPASLDFGTVARGTTAERELVVTNNGAAPLRVTGVATDAGSDPEFTVVDGTTAKTIAPGGTAAYTVRFAPPGNSSGGPRSAVVRTTSDDPADPQVTTAVSGVVGIPSSGVDATSLDFGRVAVDDRTNPPSADRFLRVTNQSSCAGCDLQITGLAISGPAAADYALPGAPSLPAKVGAGNQLVLTVRFDPSLSGTRAASLRVTTDDPGQPTFDVALTGAGLLPGISAVPDLLVFGPTVVAPQCAGLCGVTSGVALTNTGSTELILDQLAVTGTGFSGPGAATPPQRLQLGETVSTPVTFRPSTVARKVTGNLHVEDSVASDPGNTVARDVPTCGEAVGRGARILVVDRNGVAVPSATVKFASNGVTPNVNVNARNLPLTTIAPPTTCRTVRYHYENQNLGATDQSNPRGSYYAVTATVGSRHSTVTFGLAPNEFKEIIMTVG